MHDVNTACCMGSHAFFAFLKEKFGYGSTGTCFVLAFFTISADLSSDMQVSLTCGSLEKLMRVEEPSRCEYIATLLTPAACTPTEVQAVQDRLATLNQELEGDHSEL